ncbi:homoserine kinase [Sporomusaceae bacterium BoRhaA]|uniref:homoserine kinase n=1 Tax=Pelorhabdus rhamnosifermentans TaxID=2772457 RepID=UPI001C061A89|nr:homoserine kinase [Pelorhabdus rhamnosifermentans]MBU2701045.1 homoserine kinase [Pelorhabdus rhamnosifermentans]
MLSKTIRIPGTTANCGPGFDAVGMACTIYNYLTIEETGNHEIHVEVEGEGIGQIPDSEGNIAVQAALSVFDRVHYDHTGFVMKMKNAVPLARGLGSSAAAIVGGLVAANCFTGEQLSTAELLDMATAIEGHPDNVAPALLGGVTVSFMDDEMHAKSLRFVPPTPLAMVVAVPDFSLATSAARQVLPKHVAYQDAVFNVSRVALLIGSLCSGDYRYLSSGLEDKLHQPYRKPLIKGIDSVFVAAQQAGAIGTAISGSGPCIIAFTTKNAQKIGKAMVLAFQSQDIGARYYVLELDTQGAQEVL